MIDHGRSAVKIIKSRHTSRGRIMVGNFDKKQQQNERHRENFHFEREKYKIGTNDLN